MGKIIGYGQIIGLWANAIWRAHFNQMSVMGKSGIPTCTRWAILVVPPGMMPGFKSDAFFKI